MAPDSERNAHLDSVRAEDDDQPLILEKVDIAVSMQCTLHCIDCNSLVPYYARPQPMDTQAVLVAARAFLEAVDGVHQVHVVGGEPLMQKELPQLLRLLLDSPKVGHMVLISNSTLMPKSEVMELLRDERASLWLSNYGPVLCPHHKQIVDACLEQDIMVYTYKDPLWRDLGDFACRSTDPQVLARIYHHCGYAGCKQIWNGEFHSCHRSVHGRALGLINMKDGDYVRLLETDYAQRRVRIRALCRTAYIDACGYCNGYGRETIPAAIQGWPEIQYKIVTAT